MAKVYQLVRKQDPGGKVRWVRSSKAVAGGRWFIDYTDHNGKQVRQVTDATTKTEAQSILRVKMGEQARAVAAGVANPEALTINLEGFLDGVFLPYLRATRRPRTVENYEAYSKLLIKRFGRKRLPEITREDVLDFQASLIRDGLTRHKHKPAPATVNRWIAFLRSVLYDAMARGYIGRNPAARIKLLPEENERTRVLSTIEEGRLDDKMPDWLAQIVSVALLAGLRQGEILRLRRQDIDRERRQIHVSAEAKDHEPRLVPYPVKLDSLFDEILPRIGGEEGANPFLFSDEKGEALPAQKVKDTFDRALVLAKINDLHFHDLRRTYSSRLVDLGVSLPVIAKLLGHSSVYVTRRYAHASDQALEAAVALMDNGSSRKSADAPTLRTAAK